MISIMKMEMNLAALLYEGSSNVAKIFSRSVSTTSGLAALAPASPDAPPSSEPLLVQLGRSSGRIELTDMRLASPLAAFLTCLRSRCLNLSLGEPDAPETAPASIC